MRQKLILTQYPVVPPVVLLPCLTLPRLPCRVGVEGSQTQQRVEQIRKRWHRLARLAVAAGATSEVVWKSSERHLTYTICQAGQ